MLATYNGERFLRAQLDSLVAQTYPNLEILAVDDRSTDETVAILNHYAAQHPHIRVVVNDTNLGYIRNFENGMLLARSDLIAPCDQDDIWHPTKLQRLAEALGHAEMVYADSRLIDEHGQPMGVNFSNVRQLGTFSNCLSFIIGNNVSGHNMLLTKPLVQRCQPFPLSMPHDQWLCFVAACSQPVLFLPTVLVDYRQHANNVFGVTRPADGAKRVRKKVKKQAQRTQLRHRIGLFHATCPPVLTHEKRVLGRLEKSYQSFTLPNNWLRMVTFFQNQKKLLATKKYGAFRKALFCLKMFVQIR